jgi:hypothetical protein
MKYASKELVELIGVFAVVASLMFVGMQLYFDRQVALSNQYANRAESQKSDLRAQLESDAYMSGEDLLWESGSRPVWWNETFEANAQSIGAGGKEFRARVIVGRLLLLQVDNLYFQYQQNLLDEETWLGMRQLLKNFWRNELSYNRHIYLTYSEPLQIRPVLLEIQDEIQSEN